jgi:predicted outer membrane protein
MLNRGGFNHVSLRHFALRFNLMLCRHERHGSGTGQPTDPQIAHIAYTAGQIDIKAAKQALGKSQNKDVKAFAEEMVRDHEAVNKPSRCSIS